MGQRLRVSLGQHSDRGRKDLNQDFHGACLPEEIQLATKGIALALADGISSSRVSQVASEAAVAGFLADYYSTSDAWSVKTSAQRVLAAINSWLYAQTRASEYRYDLERGYVCTFSALILKSGTAHLFHAGDTRISRVADGALEVLTQDHRLQLAEGQHCLARALGMQAQLELDYRSLPLRVGDIYLLSSDGVHEHLPASTILRALQEHADDLSAAARALVAAALALGSDDNLSLQILRVDELPGGDADELSASADLTLQPPPPDLHGDFDGYRILRSLHASSRSHVYLAEEVESGARVVLKVPSMDLRGDRSYLERFLLEEWIARRVNSPHVLRAAAQARRRHYLYTVMEYVEGRTLRQWMKDHPSPDLETVRGLLEQVGRGLRAFHRLEMLHQDLRPENLLIDAAGTLTIIDFGSTRVAGLSELASQAERPRLLGAAACIAPEYLLGEEGSVRSEIFSLGVLSYQLLSGGRLPYGVGVAKAGSRRAQAALRYQSVLPFNASLPPWVDAVLRRAVHPDPGRRYGEVADFLHDLRQPSAAALATARPGLRQAQPLRLWQGLAATLVLANLLYLLLA